MILTIAATRVKNSFGEIIKHVYAAGDQVIVEKGGIPVAAIIPMSDYEPLYRSQGEVDQELVKKISNAGKLAQANRQLKNTENNFKEKGVQNEPEEKPADCTKRKPDAGCLTGVWGLYRR